MFGECRSRLGIGLKSTRVAKTEKCPPIEICAKSYIAGILYLFEFPLDKGFPVFKGGGHIFRIDKDVKRPAVRKLILKPDNRYDMVQSVPPFDILSHRKT